MSQKDYDDEASSRSIEDMADFLNKRAADLDREISNTRKLLDSTLGDYEMSGRCSNEWFPPAVSHAISATLNLKNSKNRIKKVALI